jgi:hypothetical protein
MTNEAKDKDQIKASSEHHNQQAIDRRNLLLGTSTLVAAATLTSGALAQAQNAAPPQHRPRRLRLVEADRQEILSSAKYPGARSVCR